MSLHRFAALATYAVLSALFLTATTAPAQNLLVNGDFEAMPTPGIGQFSSAEIPTWRSAGVPSGTGQYDIVQNPHFLLQMDGPGGHYQGPLFPESDASAPGSGVAQHYITAAPYIWQYVTPSCDGTLTFSVSAARSWNPNHDYTAGNAFSIVPVPTEVGYQSQSGYVPISDTQAVIDLIAAHDAIKSDIILPAGQPLANAWFPFSTQATVQAGQTYAVMLEANSWTSRLSFDNASAEMACAGGVITPQDVTLLKSCVLDGAHTNNGILGQRWACQVDVSAASAPFAGDLILHDLFTDTPLVNGDILLGASVSGNGTCFQGDCSISGANFDPSGSESFTFDVFVEAVGEADVYPLENCITGEIDDGSGTMQPLTPYCTTGQWIPRSEVVKTCDPIPENATAPYTMNCSIEVTASGLVGGTYVSVMDAFAAQPPSIATVTPTFMNVTSTENWDCIDHALNTPSSIGICELPAEDLMAAGGSSTLDISFQFDVDQTPTQVANCRFTDIHSGSYLDKLSGQRGALRSPIQSGAAQASGWPQMPDGCVFVDVPAETVVTSDTPEFDVTKACKPIGERMVMGATGWFQPWACTITVTSNGVPFNDTLWLGEDMFYGPNSGSQSITSITSGDPWQCTPAPYGTVGNQPVCGIQGSQFPHNTSTLLVTLNLFGGVADEFGAENCAALTMGKEPGDNPDEILAEGCTTIINPPDPKEPQIDLVKTCEPAVLSGNDQWTVACTLTITGQNLPAGQQFRVTDELMSSTTQTATFGVMNAQTNACGGGPMTGGTMAGCDLTTDDINAAGGTLTIPYTGTYNGPGGRPIDGPQAQNCAFVDVPSLGLHGPPSAQGGNGKSCVPIEFKLEATGGASDVILDPVKPDVGGTGGTVVTGPALDATAGAGTLVLPVQTPSITKTCDPLVFVPGAQTATADCHISIFVPNGSQIEVTRLADVATALNSSSYIVQGPADLLTGAPALNCIEMTNAGGGTAAFCAGPSVTSLSGGGQASLAWTAELVRPRDPDPQYQNCAQLTYRATPNGPLQAANACHVFEMSLDDGKQSEAGAPLTPTPAPLLEHSLKTRKQQTSACVPDRNTQRYSCGFRITVTNEGSAPFDGPLVVTDTFASPWAQAITQTSGGGWVCAQPVGGAVSCENAGLNLPQGSFSVIDLDMEVQGLVNGGTWQNCAATGIPDDRTQRVAAIQQVMNARGLKAGPVDGRPGTKTYRALAQLQRSLGLPVSREFDDALFAALGLPLAKPGEKACVVADLPPMPKPPIQCERTTTVQKGESCQCRYDNMVRRNATACQCKGGYAFIAGKGCVEQVVAPPPKPVPAELVCDKRSTRARGGKCVCLDPKNAVKTSASTCACRGGVPMIGGKCLSIAITPGKDVTDTPDSPAGTEKCRIKINGICIK